MDRASRTIFALCGFVVSCACASNQQATMQAAEREVESQAGEGVFCAWRIWSFAARVGETCLPGEHPEVQAELRRGVQRLRDYALRNADPPIAEEDAEAWEFEYGGGKYEKEVLCDPDGDALDLFNNVVAEGVDRIRAEVDRLTARPGKPTWNGCSEPQ